jgi:hypothetical protein
MSTEIELLTDKEIEIFIKYPHAFGNYLGYDLLDDIHSKWIKYCWCTKENRSLQAHRKSYKTTAILIVGTIWWLTFVNPEETILFLRKSWEQAADIVIAVKKQFESDEMRYVFKSLHPQLNQIIGKPNRDTAFSLITKIKITPEPNVYCLGMGGNITGSHPTKIFADDIITIKDRISKAERKSTITFINELTNIETVDGNTIYTGTPWHPDDGWTKLPKPKRYPVGSIDIQGFTKEKIQEYKAQLGSSLFAANYGLKHIADEDKLFSEPIYGQWPEKAKRIQAWCDPSYEGKATTALSMIAIDMNDITYLRGWVWSEHIIACYDKIINAMKKWLAGTLFVETNADKGYSKRDLSEKYPSVIGRNEKANKHIKIISFLKQNWAMLIFANDCQPEYINQIMDYTEDADLKDAADSAASLIREMRIGKRSILERF